MKITHNKVGQNVNTTDAKSDKTAHAANADKSGAVKKNLKTSEAAGLSSSANVGSHATKVELSPRVQDIKKIKETVKNTPDVNTEKVAKFKQMIAEGKYKVDAKAVADKMVDEALQSTQSES